MLHDGQSGFRPAARIGGLELSEIVQISERAAQLRASGRDIVALSTGEPDAPTPDFIVEAAYAAAQAGETRYTPTAGTVKLRAEIAAANNAEIANVIVSTGAKQVIYDAMAATLDPGDEVIIPAPYWTTYSDIVRMCGGVAVVTPCSMADGFKLSATALEAAITPRTRWLMLNSPSNPTGAIYSAEELRALAEVLARHPHVWVVSDEIYEHLSYVPFAPFSEVAPELRNRLLVVNGVSKAWSMTGWRVGWGVGPPALISAMIAVQGQITSGASSVSQAAALAALTGDKALLGERRKTMLARRNKVVAALNAMPGLECPAPDGAFYVFPSCAALLSDDGGPFATEADFCGWLLDEAGVAIVPGRAFGLAGHVRLSFAYSDDELSKGLSSMSEALERIAR